MWTKPFVSIGFISIMPQTFSFDGSGLLRFSFMISHLSMSAFIFLVFRWRKNFLLNLGQAYSHSRCFSGSLNSTCHIWAWEPKNRQNHVIWTVTCIVMFFLRPIWGSQAVWGAGSKPRMRVTPKIFFIILQWYVFLENFFCVCFFPLEICYSN